MRQALGAAALLAGAVVSASCGGQAQARPSAPAMFRPADLSDLPVPPGYLPAPGADLLAGTWAGGLVRRCQAVYAAGAEDGPLSGQAEVAAWIETRLEAAGWRRADDRGHWHRPRADGGFERLKVETGRNAGRTIIRYSLTGGLPERAAGADR